MLVLAMLGLMALIGVTFATFTGQARMSRNYALSVTRPSPADTMDFALSQLIGDTNDVRSAIRGHSMAQDVRQRRLQQRLPGDQTSRLAGRSCSSSTSLVFSRPRATRRIGTIKCVTNIPAGGARLLGRPAFYGYDFTRWIVKFPPQYALPGYPMAASRRRAFWSARRFEVLFDDISRQRHRRHPNVRIFYLAMPPAWPTPTPAGNPLVSNTPIMGLHSRTRVLKPPRPWPRAPFGAR